MRLATFIKTVGELETDTLVTTMQYSLAEVKAEALLHGLGATVAEADTETLYKTLSNI